MINATKDTFYEIINEPTGYAVLVDFWADWCPPCKAMEPILQFAQDEWDALEVIKVDVDAEMDLAKSLGISSMPTLILYLDGEELGRQVGAVSRDQLWDFVQESLGAEKDFVL